MEERNFKKRVDCSSKLFPWQMYRINSISTDKILGVISRNEFIKMNKIFGDAKKDIVVISIVEPGMESFDLDILGDFKAFRTFKFNDIMKEDEDFTKLKAIPFEMAREIRKFILDNKDEQFLIHCMAGQSRSAGVAKAIECLTLFNGDVYGYKTSFASEIDKNSRYFPNLTVFDRIVGREEE